MSDEYTIKRKALEIIIQRAASSSGISSREEHRMLKAIREVKGITVGAWSSKYCCPLTLILGNEAPRVATQVQEVRQFQSDFDWLMEEYFERSLIEHGGRKFEVKVDD